MCPHESQKRAQVGELTETIPWHPAKQRSFAVHHFVVAERQNVVLGKFEFNGESLEKKTIETNQLNAKFLRLSWPARSPIKISKIVGEFSSVKQVEVKKNSLTVDSYKNEKGIYQYKKGAMPSSRVKIALPEANTAIKVRVSSRPNEAIGWIPRASGLAYRIASKQGEIGSDPYFFERNSDRFWQLEILGKDLIFGEQKPKLVFEWTAQTMFFMARGSSPYTIAYGNSAATVPDSAFDAVVGSDRESVLELEPLAARVVGPEVINTASAKVVQVSSGQGQVDWKRYLLWLFLGVAVVISSLMAWKLYADMNRVK